MYQVTKTFGTELGLSCAFRQWTAPETHCSLIHGYALGFRFVIEGEDLDHRNWLFSFGDFKAIREWLKDTFDHKTAIAYDDPALDEFLSLEAKGAIQLRHFKNVGCEKFAELVFNEWSEYILQKSNNRARLVSVECFEHGANSATYIG